METLTNPKFDNTGDFHHRVVVCCGSSFVKEGPLQPQRCFSCFAYVLHAQEGKAGSLIKAYGFSQRSRKF